MLKNMNNYNNFLVKVDEINNLTKIFLKQLSLFDKAGSHCQKLESIEVLSNNVRNI